MIRLIACDRVVLGMGGEGERVGGARWQACLFVGFCWWQACVGWLVGLGWGGV